MFFRETLVRICFTAFFTCFPCPRIAKLHALISLHHEISDTFRVRVQQVVLFNFIFSFRGIKIFNFDRTYIKYISSHVRHRLICCYVLEWRLHCRGLPFCVRPFDACILSTFLKFSAQLFDIQQSYYADG